VEGTPFGRYSLIELLGRGGMGEVWRAHDTDTDRIVAIKVLPANFSDDEDFKRRFRREAHAAARLNTPHVVPIHTYGEIDGRLYVDMRLIEGSDLQAVLADGPLEAARAIRIIGQVALALNAAHKVGLLHRDVKPSNILLDENDFAYLIDFGIARAADETRLTKSGNTIGTFAYIAPERLGTGTEDARADIYSLACVLYECLTGHPPFDEATMAQLVAAHLNTPPPKPSTTQPDVPAQIDPVIATGMAKDPDNRYATTVDLADAARDAITVPIKRPAPAPTLLPPTQQAPNHVPAQPITVKAESPAPAKPAPPPQPAPPIPTRDGGISRRTTIALIVGAIALVGVIGAAVGIAALGKHGPSGSSPPSSSPPSSPPSSSPPSSQSMPEPPPAQGPTMNGHYIMTVTRRDTAQTVTNNWYFTPCGDGCANASGSSPIPGGQARLVNGQWTIDGPITIRCPDGTSVPGVTTADYTWDPNTLVGTLQATQTKEACGLSPASQTMDIQLRQAA
jgi:serine/threonine protein kinase, bacterial